MALQVKNRYFKMRNCQIVLGWSSWSRDRFYHQSWGLPRKM